MKKILMLAAVAAIAAATTAAQADTLGYNGNVKVDSTGDLYFGAGNLNGDFATSTASTGEVLGLRADIRFGSLITATDSSPGVTNLYTVPAGGSPAAWDFVYSVDVSGTSNTLANYVATLTITPPVGVGGSFDPLLVPDNNGPRNEDKTTVAQNAENIGFPSFGGNPNLTGVYTFNLQLFAVGGVAGSAIASDTIFVNVVPTPLPSAANMGLGMLAVIGAAGMLRKKLRTV
jgi:hypothetical protein